MSVAQEEILRGVRVLDGGLATELEYRGAKIDGPLWSAHVLEDAPERVVATHRAYAEAGAEVVATASYQVSRMGYAEVGLRPEQADVALLRAVELAREAVEGAGRRVAVAASLGPYGAALHNGAEYHGNYDVSHAELVRFHRERIAVLAEATGRQAPDLLAFETIPSLDEARAIGEAMADWPELAAWISFQCRDEQHVAHGEPLREAAALAAGLPQTVAVGVNCVPPSRVTALIGELRAATEKPLMAYPNSGEGWDASARKWTGVSDPEGFGALAAEWFAAGAQMVGGCCRTRPAHIREVAQAAGRFSG
ncbi:MAG TPA: homocysteine S-methyltransferase [Terracidiphilus sp.]|nr:homocysteine S-methyltransferase [Terracidiphilus sp.]